MSGRIRSGNSWWQTDDGLEHKDFIRSLSTVRLAVESEPRTKRARQDDELRQLLSADVQLWRSKETGGWPRPKANIAIDAEAHTGNHQPPRVDGFCKWLLDQLGAASGDPVVFHDDRQVKLLFARVTRKDDRTASPRIHVDAQRESVVREGLRRARDLGAPWRETALFDEAFDGYDWEDWIDTWTGWDSDAGREWLKRSYYGLQFQHQREVLIANLELSSDLLMAHAATNERKEIAAEVGVSCGDLLALLSKSHYTFDLGPLPVKEGDTGIFKAHVREILSAKAREHSRFFPLLHCVGLTIFYVESPQGKDLDNIFLAVVPIVLDELKLPVETVSPFAPIELLTQWDEVRQGRVAPPGPAAVSFIEAIALNDVLPSMFAPGTVILTLSPGSRVESLWQHALGAIRSSSC